MKSFLTSTISLVALLIIVSVSAEAVTPLELYHQADSLFKAGDTKGLEKLCEGHHLLINSIADIALKQYLATSQSDTNGERDQRKQLLEFLSEDQAVSSFYQDFVREVLVQWTPEDVQSYQRARQLVTVGTRRETEHWPDSLELAADIFQSLGHLAAVSETEYAIGYRYYYVEKQYDSAHPHFLRAETAGRSVGDSDRLCQILTACGNSASKVEGGTPEAMVKMEEAIKIAWDADLHSQLINCNSGLGAIYYYINHYRAAAVRLQVADSICTANSLDWKRFFPLALMALCYDQLGDSRAADSVYAVVEGLIEGNEKQEATLGWVYAYQANFRLDMGDTTGVRSKLAMAVDISNRNNSKKCRWQVMYLLGRLDRMAKNFVESERQLRSAVEGFDDIKDRLYPTKELGLYYLDCSNLDSAAVYLELARTMLVSARSDVPRSTFRHKYLADKYDLIAALVTLALKNNDAARAFDLAEEFRAQSLRESMLETLVGEYSGTEESVAIKPIEKEIADLIRGVRLCADPQADLSLISERIERLNDSLINIRLLHSGQAPLTSSAESSNYNDFAAISGGGKIGLYYFVHGRNVFLWYSLKGKIYFEDLSKDRPAILEEVRSALEKLKKPPVSRRGLESLDSLLTNLQSLVPRDLHPYIATSNGIRIFPSGILSYFPLETIMIDGTYLGQLVPVEYYPCLSIFQFLADTKTSPGKLSSIALFGGTFEQNGANACDYQVPGFVAKYASTRELPGVAEEIATIKTLFDDRVTDFVNGFSQEEVLSNPKIGAMDILHFATHGVIMDDYPEFSSLLLPVDKSSGTDEVLRVSEITPHGITSPLVVLSACRSGFGQYVTGEGIMGFSRSFMIGGARSVVVSLWPVDDQASGRYFAEPFYRAILEGQSTSEALLAVRKAMLDSQFFSHPYYWAPFVAYGNWQ